MKITTLFILIIPMVATTAYARSVLSPTVELNRAVVVGNVGESGNYESGTVTPGISGLTNCVIQINQSNGMYSRVTLGSVTTSACQSSALTYATANRTMQ